MLSHLSLVLVECKTTLHRHGHLVAHLESRKVLTVSGERLALDRLVHNDTSLFVLKVLDASLRLLYHPVRVSRGLIKQRLLHGDEVPGRGWVQRREVLGVEQIVGLFNNDRRAISGVDPLFVDLLLYVSEVKMLQLRHGVVDQVALGLDQLHPLVDAVVKENL